MIKVLVVDDDYSQRGYIKNIIDWVHEGFEICGEAGSGIAALSLIDELKPDLLLLDINMPGMDGLELSKKLYLSSTPIKIVIISGFDEFEYAKEAMAYGAQHYILKPIDKSELLQVIKSIRSEITEAANNKLKMSVLYQKLNHSLPLLREKFLSELVCGKIDCDQESFWEKVSFLEIPLKNTLYISVIIEIDNIHGSLKNETNRQILKLVIIDTCNEIIPCNVDHVVFNDVSEKIAVILESNEENRNQTMARLKDIHEKTHCKLGIDTTVACGSPYTLINISQSYNEALKCIKAKSYSGCNKVLDYMDLETMEEKFIPIADKCRDQILIQVHQQNIEALKSEITEILNNYKTMKTTMEYMRILALEILNIGFTYIALTGYSIPQVLGEDYKPMEELQILNSLEGIQEYLEQRFAKIISFFQKLNKPKISQLVVKAKGFIDTNYHLHELSLESIASSLYVHPVYLSSTFKKELNKTITEYIIDIRMKHALELLKSANNITISDISASVGYEDYYYFSKSFKKYYGFTPNDCLP